MTGLRQVALLRDAAKETHAVVALLSQAAMPMRLTDERIASLIQGG